MCSDFNIDCLSDGCRPHPMSEVAGGAPQARIARPLRSTSVNSFIAAEFGCASPRSHFCTAFC